ncbi:MAG: DUF99 family protein [Pyrobaculum sp.]
MAIAESFKLEDGVSIYAGVLTRRDGVVEEVALDMAKLGGVDGTAAAMRILDKLLRPDVSMVMLDGCVVSFYNWIDGGALWQKYRKPVACYVFEEAAKKLFQDWQERVEAYRRLGLPTLYHSKRGYRLYVRAWGIDPRDAGRAAEVCTKFGKMPEPIRVAKLVAGGVRQFLKRGKTSLHVDKT